ncbi:MAG: lamin tail domain-containing protein [Elusimicrobia bacterium]|nr:lamin tail domain-containing protein [Elusimicrobiota bacterium]
MKNLVKTIFDAIKKVPVPFLRLSLRVILSVILRRSRRISLTRYFALAQYDKITRTVPIFFDAINVVAKQSFAFGKKGPVPFLPFLKVVIARSRATKQSQKMGLPRPLRGLAMTFLLAILFSSVPVVLNARTYNTITTIDATIDGANWDFFDECVATNTINTDWGVNNWSSHTYVTWDANKIYIGVDASLESANEILIWFDADYQASGSTGVVSPPATYLNDGAGSIDYTASNCPINWTDTDFKPDFLIGWSADTLDLVRGIRSWTGAGFNIAYTGTYDNMGWYNAENISTTNTGKFEVVLCATNVWTNVPASQKIAILVGIANDTLQSNQFLPEGVSGTNLKPYVVTLTNPESKLLTFWDPARNLLGRNGIMLSECMYNDNNATDIDDWVELTTIANSTITLTNYVLRYHNETALDGTFTFPAVTISSGNYLVVHQKAGVNRTDYWGIQHIYSGTNSDWFGTDAGATEIYRDANVVGKSTGIIDFYMFDHDGVLGTYQIGLDTPAVDANIWVNDKFYDATAGATNRSDERVHNSSETYKNIAPETCFKQEGPTGWSEGIEGRGDDSPVSSGSTFEVRCTSIVASDFSTEVTATAGTTVYVLVQLTAARDSTYRNAIPMKSTSTSDQTGIFFTAYEDGLNSANFKGLFRLQLTGPSTSAMDSLWAAENDTIQVRPIISTSNVDTVTATYPTGDITAPGAITDLYATGITTSTANGDFQKTLLSWTAPGDDNYTGTCSSYTVRYATWSAGNTSALWDTWWTHSSVSDAASKSNLPTPAGAGTSQSYTVTGLTEGTTLYWAIKSVDESANMSQIDTMTQSGNQPWARVPGTYHPINCDGATSDWSFTTEKMDLRNNNTFFFTWSSTAVYICYGGSNGNMNDADFFVLFDTHSSYDITKGTTAPVNWNGTNGHRLPFGADFCLTIDDPPGGLSPFVAVSSWTGTAWTSPTDGTGISSSFIGNAATPITEVAILWSTLNNPSSLRVMAFHKWESAKNIYNSFPDDNPAPNTDTNVTFTHYYNFTSTQSCQFPKEFATVEAPFAPDAPSGLTQLNQLGTVLNSMKWTNSTTIISSFTQSDPNAGTNNVRFYLQITSVTTSVPAADWSQSFHASTSGWLAEGTTGYKWPTLSNNGTYWWRVWSEDSGGLTSSTSTTLGQGGTARFGFDNSGPAAPATLTLTNQQTALIGIDISWAAVTDSLSGLASYYIYCSSVSAITDANKGDVDHYLLDWDPPGTTSDSDTRSDLQPNSIYFYAVAGVDIAGNIGSIKASSKLTHRIEVDATETDWQTATLPSVDNTATVEALTTGETTSPGGGNIWVWKDKANDERTDAPDPDTNYDISEFRITADSEYIYFRVKYQTLTVDTTSHIAVTISTDTNTNGGPLNWIGDDSTQSGSIGLGVEYGAVTQRRCYPNVAVHQVTGGGTQIEIDYQGVAGSWNPPTTAPAGGGNWVNVPRVDFMLSRAEFNLDGSKTARISVCNFANQQVWNDDGDSTWDVTYPAGVCDALDSISIPRIDSNDGDFGITNSAWNQDISDGDIDFWFDIRLDANGVLTNTAPPIPTNAALTGGTTGAIRPRYNWAQTADGDAASGDAVTSWLIEHATHTALDGDLSQTDEFGYRVNLSTCVFTPTGDLKHNTTFYYRVWSRDRTGALSSTPDTWSVYVDTVGPVAISNLTALAGWKVDTVVLRWTAPQENSAFTNKASSYIMRYSTASFSNSEWDAAWVKNLNEKATIPTPSSPGVTELMLITGLTNGTSYWFGIKSLDALGNTSAINSNTQDFAVAQTSSPIVINEIAPWQTSSFDMVEFYIKNACYVGGLNFYGKENGTPSFIMMKTFPLTGDWQYELPTGTYIILYCERTDTDETTVTGSTIKIFTTLGTGLNGVQDNEKEGYCVLSDTAGLTIGSNIMTAGTVLDFVAYDEQNTNGFTSTWDDDNIAYAITNGHWISTTSATIPITFDCATGKSISVSNRSLARNNTSAKTYNSKYDWTYRDTFSTAAANGTVEPTSGAGTCTVTPNTAQASTAGTWKFKYTNTSDGTRHTIALTVPYGWTQPQTTNGNLVGFTTAYYKTTGQPPGNANIPAPSGSAGYGIMISTIIGTNAGWRVAVTVGDTADDIYVEYGATYTATSGQATAPATDGTYTFRVYSDTAGVNVSEIATSPTITVTESVPPAAISDLTALEGTNDGIVKLNWTSPGDDGVSGNLTGTFRIKYSSVSIISAGNFDAPSSSLAVVTVNISTGPLTPLTACTTTMYGLNPGTSYFFAIKTADDVSNWSVWNSSADVLTVNTSAYCAANDQIPPAPTNLVATQGNQQITLTWTAVTGEPDLDFYRIYRDSWTYPTGNDFKVYASTPQNYQVFTDTGLTNNTTYMYKITVFDLGISSLGYSTANESAFSNIYSTYPTTVPPKAALVYFSTGTTSPDNTTSQIPSFRKWDGVNFGSEETSVNMGGCVDLFTVVRMCPQSVRQETIVGVLDRSDAATSPDIDISTYTATNGWGTVKKLSTDSDVTTVRCFDIAYEQLSGDYIVVARTNNSTSVPWYSVNGAAPVAGPTHGTGTIQWVRLEPKPNSDEMILVTCDSNEDVYASVWNGTTFGNTQLLEIESVSSSQGFDVAYTQSAGVGFVVWVDTNSTRPQYRTWDGYSWSAETTTAFGHYDLAAGRNIKLAANPKNNELLLGTNDNGDDINVEVWSSTLSVWLGGKEIDATARVLTVRTFDVEYEKSSGDGLLVYADAAGGIPTVWTWNAGGSGVWAAGTNANDTGAATLNWVQLASDDLSDKIQLVTSDADNDINVQTWSGTAWGSINEVETESSNSYESFFCNFPKPVPSDTVAPAAVTSLSGLTVSGSTGTIKLTWSAPGDDVWLGRLTNGCQYRIDYTTSTENRIWYYWTAVSSPTGSDTFVPGTFLATTVSDLVGDVTYYCKIKYYDGTQWGELSNEATAYANPMILSVDITFEVGTQYNFGEVALGASTTTVYATSTITVTNDGNILENFGLRCATNTAGSPWYSIETSSGADNYLLRAVFCSTQPAMNNFSEPDPANSDILSDDNYRTCGTERYAVTETYTGVNVAVNGTRKLWLRLDMPITSGTAAPQEFIIYIRAESP